MINVKELRISPSPKIPIAKRKTEIESNVNVTKIESDLQIMFKEMYELQYKLYVEKKKALLIVLQGMDTSGKDGTIRHVIRSFNPISCRVESFKVPSVEERMHDFLWRIHKVLPQKGFISVFNRSHYEDVIEPRVQELLPKSVWSKRYRQINQFEKYLNENNIIIIKLFLHISKKEQKKRLLERLSDPLKRWKVDEDDFLKRKKWYKYMDSYEDILNSCSTIWAPWYYIPSNNKRIRDWIIARIVVDTMKNMKIKYPEYNVPKMLVN